jgi:hypothetical protein
MWWKVKVNDGEFAGDSEMGDGDDGSGIGDLAVIGGGSIWLDDSGGLCIGLSPSILITEFYY